MERIVDYYYSKENKKPSRVLEKIDMNKTLDEIIDSMKDEKFDKFTKGIIDSVHKKRY